MPVFIRTALYPRPNNRAYEALVREQQNANLFGEILALNAAGDSLEKWEPPVRVLVGNKRKPVAPSGWKFYPRPRCYCGFKGIAFHKVARVTRLPNGPHAGKTALVCGLPWLGNGTTCGFFVLVPCVAASTDVIAGHEFSNLNTAGPSASVATNGSAVVHGPSDEHVALLRQAADPDTGLSSHELSQFKSVVDKLETEQCGICTRNMTRDALRKHIKKCARYTI